MQRLNKIIFISVLLMAGVLVYLFFSESGHPQRVDVEPQTASVSEQIDNLTSDTEKEDEERKQLEADQDTNETSSITEEIKKNVRGVIRGVINLFNKNLKVVAVGDSLTQGVGDDTDSGGYVGILNNTFEENDLNISIKNYGKRGNRTDQLLKRLGEEEISTSIKEADTVLITIGANDIMKIVKSNFNDLKYDTFEKEKPAYTDRLRSIFDKIHNLNPDTNVYLIGFYNPFEGYFNDIQELDVIMRGWNDAGKSVTEEYENVHYIPTADLFNNTKLELLAGDYFHPNSKGYKLIAERVLKYVDEISLEPESLETEDKSSSGN
jgi:lysophospholipase L1-like esterase